jgi:glycosyltransferase involved in cell wall biosynthesis
MALVESILTISIPTYNRPEKIKTQVRLLLPQLTDQVDLVVYDNCSDIPVKNYFSEDELTKFTLIRNKVNVGGDANIARCFENCNTKWLWTLSDDDFVKFDAVEIILNQINQNSDYIFINFCKGISFETYGFEELAYEFKSPTVFSSSFTMSSCLYNMSKLKVKLEHYYNNLSSMMGTTILVLKYVHSHRNARCKFVDFSPIESFNIEVGWNYGDFIRRSRLFKYSFNSYKNFGFYRSLFLGYHLTNYWLLIHNRKESKVTYLERWRLFGLAVFNQGLINALYYTPKVLIRAFVTILFNKSK